MPQVVLHIGEHLLVIVEATGMQRITDRDPMVIDIAEIARMGSRPIANVIVTFGTEDDIAETVRLVREGRPVEALRYACRGYTDKPADNMPPVRLTSTGVSS